MPRSKSKRRYLITIALIAAALLAGSSLNGGIGGVGKTERAPDPRIATVTEVIDGDTIRVRFVSGIERTVRYIGIDTPEKRGPYTREEPCGTQASDLNERLVMREKVRLQFDRTREDRYGRLRAYVYRQRDSLFINEELLRRGLARVSPYRDRVERFTERFEALYGARRISCTRG